MRALLELFFPPTCLACNQPLPPRLELANAPAPCSRSLLCPTCEPLLAPLTNEVGCPRCGLPSPRLVDPVTPEKGCVECDPLPKSFIEARSAFSYRGTAGLMVRHLKYQHAPHLARHLALLANEVLGDWLGKVVPGALLVPIPMTMRRELLRGYNQAREIARTLTGLHHGELASDDALVRARWGGAQARHSTREARLANLSGSFAVRRPEGFSGRRVLIIDDVMTTGATAAFAAQAIAEAGAAEVRLFSVVRARLHRREDATIEKAAS